MHLFDPSKNHATHMHEIPIDNGGLLQIVPEFSAYQLPLLVHMHPGRCRRNARVNSVKMLYCFRSV